MRTGLLVPISSELLGLIFLLALVAIVIYGIVYSISASTKKAEVSDLKSSFEERPQISERRFGFPENSFLSYSVKHYDERLGFATQRMGGGYGLSICVHSGLPHLRLYFFYDFKPPERVEALIYLEDQSGERLMLKQTPESTMFAHDNVRYFHISHQEGPNFLRNARKLLVGNDQIVLSSSDSSRLSQTVDEFFSYPANERDKFLTWSKAQ